MLYRVVASVVMGLSLLACGGGGGGGGSDPSAPESFAIAPSSTTALPNSSVSFSIIPSNGTIAGTSFAWDFGDGTSTTSQGEETVRHTYTSSNRYTVRVTTSIGNTTLQDEQNVYVFADQSYSLSGTVSSLVNTVIDGDTNDPAVAINTNSTLGTAQDLPPVSVVSGFVTNVATGVEGDQFRFGSDPIDYYRVELQQGQVVFLEIADWIEGDFNNNDFDLSLIRVSDNLEVASSSGVNKTELITVPESGLYYISVYPYSAQEGTGNYTLRLIHQNQSLSLKQQALTTQQEFVTGEALLSELHGQSRAVDQASTKLVKLPAKRETSIQGTWREQAGVKVTDQYKAKLDTLAAIKELMLDGKHTAQPNYLYQALSMPNDPLYQRQWHYPQIKLPEAWSAMEGRTLNDVVVAVIDTGMYQSHPDLVNQLTNDGYDFISNTSISLDGDGVDANPEDPGDRSQNDGSSSWHGTHVGGTVAAETNNGVGVAGVAPQIKLMNLRALGFGGGTTWDIAQSMLYAAGLANHYNLSPDKPADIINMSLGGAGYDSYFDSVTQQVVNSGAIVVAAAGNESTSLASYPAAFDNVIGVSALDANNNLTGYSNFGFYIDVAAPGGDSSRDLNGDGYGDGVFSTYVDERSNRSPSYANLNGTSMAAPHIAGVLALMKQLDANLNTASVLQLLANGSITNDLGSAGWDTSYGYGIIDAEKAVAAVGASPTPDRTYLSLDSSSIYVDSLSDTASFTISKVGSSELTVSSVLEGADWLSITAPGSSSGLGTYQLSVDRDGLSDGTYTEHISISSSEGQDLTVLVTMQISSLVADDSGAVYILLIDERTGQPAYQTLAEMVNRRFDYAFSSVQAGAYRVISGTDLDNDYFICDEGELCGAYPVLTEPQSVILTGNQSNVDLIVEPVTTESADSAATVAPQKFK